MSSKVASKSSKASGAKNGKTGSKSLNSKSKSKSKTNGESSKQSKSKKSQENKGIKSHKPVSKAGQVNNKGSKSLKTKTKPSHNGNKNNSKSNLKSNSKSKSSVSKKVQAYNAKSQSSKGNGKKNTSSNNRNPKNSKNSKIDNNNSNNNKNNKNGKNNNSKNGVSKSTDIKKKSKEQKNSKQEKESTSNIRVSDEKEDEKERESNKNSANNNNNNNSKLDTSPQAAAAKWRQTAKFAARKQNSQHRLSINESNDNKSIGDIISLFNSKNDNGNDNGGGNNNNNNSLRNRMSIGSDNSDTGNRFLNVSNHERKLSNMKFRKNNNDSMSSIGEMIEQNDGNNNDDSKNNDNNNNNNGNNNNGIRISISSGAGGPSRHFNGIIKPSSVSSNSVSPLNNQLSLGEANLNNNNNNSNKSPKWPKSANSPKTTKSPTTTSNNNNNKNKNNGSPSNRKNKTDNDEPKRVLSLKERMALLNESKEKDAAHIKPDDKPQTKVKPLANVDKNKIANLFNKRINEQMHSNKHDNDNDNNDNNGSNDNNSSHGGNSIGMMGYNIFGGNPANVSEIIKQKIAEKNLNNQKDNQSLKTIIQSGNIDEMTGSEATEILTNAGFYSKATIVGFNHYGSDGDNLLAFNMNNNAIFDRYILKNEKENFENLILKSLSHNNENILQIQMCNCKITDEFFAKVLYILQNNVFGIINDSIGNDSDMNDDEKYDLLNGYKPGIKELWFESNIIGDPGFLALADFIEKDKHIKVIKLMNNKITTISTSVLNRLISAIEKNTCLTTFAYDGFRFSQQKDRFEKCIRRNNDLARKAKQKTFMVKVGQNE